MTRNKFCIRCGAPLSPTDAFCMKCGAAVPQIRKKFCIYCGAQIGAQDAFCLKCGKPVDVAEKTPSTVPPERKPVPPKQPPAQVCSRCGGAMPLGVRKCPKCGKKVKRKRTKGQIVRRVIAAVLVVTLLVSFLWTRQLMPWDLIGKKTKLAELKAGQTVQPGMTVSYAKPQTESARGVDSARSAIADTLGIDAQNLDNGRRSEVLDRCYYRFDQVYNGIPVYGRVAILEAEDNGKASGVYGNYMELENVKTVPTVSEEEAKKTLSRKVGKHFVLSKELTIYTLNANAPELAWVYTVVGEKFSGECLVSAETGKLLLKNAYERTDTVTEGNGVDNTGTYRVFGNVLQDDGQYRLEDIAYQFVICNSGGESYVLREYFKDCDSDQRYYAEITDEAVQFYDEDGRAIENADEIMADFTHFAFYIGDEELLPMTQSSNVWTDPEAVSLAYNLQVTQDFYHEMFSLEGYDLFNPHETEMYAIYNDDLHGDPGNAYSTAILQEYSTGLLAFGRNNTITPDLVAHEYTHTVESCISTMIYNGESGALMEAYSDIFGELVEDYENDRDLDGDCDWVNEKRYIKFPIVKANPSSYKGLNWGNTESSIDHGYVHHNSTVVSQAAYNMVRDGLGLTEPLSNEQLARLFFATMQKLTPNSSMKEFGELLMQQADEAFTAEEINFSNLLRIHLALVRAGLIEFDPDILWRIDWVRVVAHHMAGMIPQFMLDEIGYTREQMEESYYLELMAFWIQLNDPEMQEALRELWRYVIAPLI